MVYLVILSLALHLVSFYIIVILYQKIDRQKPLNQDKLHNEIEDLLLSYTTEMKENNERLARRIKNLSISEDLQGMSKKSNLNVGEKASSMELQTDTRTEKEQQTDTYDQYEPPIPQEDEEEVTLNSSSTSQILSLYEQGIAIPEIAKRMQMGAGEVELLLKFYK